MLNGKKLSLEVNPQELSMPTRSMRFSSLEITPAYSCRMVSIIYTNYKPNPQFISSYTSCLNF